MTGPVIIELATCRAVRAELSGPMTMSAVQETSNGVLHYSAAGEVRVEIESQFGHAPPRK